MDFRTVRIFAAAVLSIAACHDQKPRVVDAGPPPVISQDILVRPVQTSQAEVEHVIVGWADLAPAYRGRMSARALARDRAAAEAVVRMVVEGAREGQPFEELMRAYSDDPSAQRPDSFTVRADGTLEPALQALALRLHVGEVGVCQTAYGYDVLKRVK